MFDGPAEQGGVLDEADAFNLLAELEQNRSEEIRRQRQHFRITIKAEVLLQPGNASEILEFKVKGVSGDISEGGCSILFPIPANVGDIYRLQFNRRVVDLPLQFAQCVRCRLVRDDAYECGFRFFSPIALPENLNEAVESDGSQAG